MSFSGWLIQVPLGTMYNPVFFIGTAYAIHGDIPVPWYPASHGCVRIWMDAATWFHNDLSIGGSHPTHIYIRGTAPYYLAVAPSARLILPVLALAGTGSFALGRAISYAAAGNVP